MTSKRYVTLGNGRPMPLGAYVRAWKTILTLAPDVRLAGSPRDPREICDAATALRELRAGMHDRINAHLPWHGRGRKWCSEWWWPVWRASRELNTPRLVITYLPADLRERFAHRLER